MIHEKFIITEMGDLICRVRCSLRVFEAGSGLMEPAHPPSPSDQETKN